jgi:hypothetical protein
MSYLLIVPHLVSYAGNTSVQQLPTVRDVSNEFSIDRIPPAKVKSNYHIQCSPIYNETSYGGDFKQANSVPEDDSGTAFAINVDTLMKAIQAK